MLANLPAILLDTILTHLTTLFLSGAPGDPTAARQAARQLLATYHPRNGHELRLAAQIISFSLQALAALGQAADPDLPLTRVLRLRGSAVSLNRESEKAQRRLDQSQETNLPEPAQPELAQPKAAPLQPAQPGPAQPEFTVNKTEPALSVPQAATAMSIAEERIQTDLRIAASLRRAADRVAAIQAAKQSNTAP